MSRKPSTKSPGCNFKKKCHPCMSIFQLPPLRCPCKDFSISLFLHPNNLCWRIFVKFFSKSKFRVYNAVSSLAIRVRKRVTRYNWHGNNLYAVSICHFCRLAKYSLRARCHIYNSDVFDVSPIMAAIQEN